MRHAIRAISSTAVFQVLAMQSVMRYTSMWCAVVQQQIFSDDYSGFPSSCNAKRHALYKHVRAQLFNSGFSVTTTDSQDFKEAYAYNSTVTEYYRSF